MASAQQSSMLTAAGNLEAALSALEAAYASYQSNAQIASGAATRGDAEAMALVVGERLDQLLAARMRGLGLGGILDQVRVTFVVTSNWAVDLGGHIRSLVP
jgi:hypothetical protein